MQNLRMPLVLSLATALAGCHMNWRSDYGGDGTLIATKSDGAGGKREYRLYAGDDGQPSLNLTSTITRERAFFGVNTGDIDLDRAKELGVEAWKGVEVTSVVHDSAAGKSGLVKGDVITAVNDTPVTSGAMFGEFVRSRLSPRETAHVAVMRRVTASSTPAQLAIDVTPDVRTDTESKTDSIPLSSVKGLQQYSGLQVVGLGPELARDAYGADGPVAVIAGVMPGSPAYLAGLRSGDRVVSIDGKPVAGLDDVRAAAASRAHALDLPARDLGDVGNTAASTMPINLSVVGPLGAHEASIVLEPDLEETSSFHFPILFDYESNPSRTEWEFLDFIFQFGATYHSNYLSSPTRSERMTSKLSMLPFGMFEVEKTPTQNRYTALWFIKWGTRG